MSPWYWVSAGKQGTHHGVLTDGTVRAECRATFQLNLPAGQRPSDPEQICSKCRLKVDTR